MFIIPTTILAVPLKTLVHVNLSGPRPGRVRIIPSERYTDGVNCTITGNSVHTHILGDVMDGEELLCRGDPRAISRYVLVHPRKDGSKYVRVTTKPRDGRGPIRRIKEFVRGPIDFYYRPINRTPLELDIPNQGIDRYINMKLVVNWEKDEDVDHREVEREVQKDPEMVSIKFTIRENEWVNYAIGIVKYGEQILEDKVDGLMERCVIWHGGPEKPTITIHSRYINGTQTEKVYKFNVSLGKFTQYSVNARLFSLYE